MSDETPYNVSDADFLNTLMSMRETAKMVLAYKKTHPFTFRGDDKLWLKDINDLEKIINDYDMLIRKLIEVNMKQGEMLDDVMKKLEILLGRTA